MSRHKVGLLILFVAFLVACPPCGAKEKEKEPEPVYYCMVTGCDGSLQLTEISREDAKAREKELGDEFKDRAKEWDDLRKKWAAVSRSPFPVLKPVRPKLTRLSKVPSSDKGRKSARKKYELRINRWNVCVVRTHTGGRSAAVVRRDRMYGKLQELQKAYAEAAIAWVLAHKDDPPGRKNDDDKPAKPSVTVVKGPLSDAELADRWAEKLAQKLDKMKEKEQAEREKKEAEAERRRQAMQKKIDEKEAGENKDGENKDGAHNDGEHNDGEHGGGDKKDEALKDGL